MSAVKKEKKTRLHSLITVLTGKTYIGRQGLGVTYSGDFLFP